MIRILQQYLDFQIIQNVIFRFMQIITRSSTKSITTVAIPGPSPVATITDIRILHDSPHYIVVDKRFDVLINEADKTFPVTVETQLTRLYPDLVNSRLPMSFYFCHRLDYATSGVLCVAKTKRACSSAVDVFQTRRAIKFYLAIVRGHISQETLTVSEPVGEDLRELLGSHRMALATSPYCSKRVRDATTHLAVLERGFCYEYPATKVLLRPITGRRHQLRLHCSSLGHTIVGDFTYSNRKDVEPYRMFLHAFRLILPSRYESLDVKTEEDPFTSDDGSFCWTSVEKLMTVEEAMERLQKL